MFGSLFSKVEGLGTCNFIKNRLQQTPVKFANFLTSFFLTEHLLRLLLNDVKSLQIIHFSQDLYSLMDFLETFFFKQVFHSQNYVQNILCLALMRHS